VNNTATITQNSGYFSMDPKLNPLMFNWNVVYFKYCDGGSFSGSNASSTPSGTGTTRLHWRGKHTERRHHRHADEARLGEGHRGGGVGLQHGRPGRVSALRPLRGPHPRAEGEVAYMTDSGLFREDQGCTTPGVCRQPHYHDRLTWVFDS